ncbi:MAG: hypothetical protein [Caudoviricetes sp.]|nr:MAG: hypothetical protein [Caudoviricetes sp.]
MQASKVKVRLKDIRSGVTVYTAHPVYGIDKVVITSRPFMKYLSCGSPLALFVKTRVPSFIHPGEFFEMEQALSDMGVYFNYRTDRRTFFKLKHAEQWVKQQGSCPKFKERQANHDEWCKTLDDWGSHFD